MRTGDKVSDSRELAYEVLERVRSTQAFANEVIDSVIDQSGAALQDRAYATRLVLGVVSSSGSLDAVINRYLDRPGSLKGKLRTAMRIAAYEILYLDKDRFAAVDQCVELAKAVQPRAAGLANAVMRRLAEDSRDFPFGDPDEDIDAFSLEQAFPVWLTELVLGELGPAKGRKFVVANNLRAPIYVHLTANRLEKSDASKLTDIDPDATPVSIGGTRILGCYRLKNSRAVADPRFIDMIESGKALISDASAQLICQLSCEAAVKAKKAYPSCLELCAGRGTKTVVMHSMLEMCGSRFGRYVAVDNVPFKADLLRRRAAEYGAKVDDSVCADARRLGAELSNETFDLVFLDAPCSGLGTMRRHPEIRWRVHPETIAENSSLDLDLLVEASRRVGIGGTLAYSTCTITSKENEEVIAAFLDDDAGKGFETEPIKGEPFLKTLLQEGGHDAHFCAMLRRKELI